MPVWITPGQMALTRMPFAAFSIAIWRMSPITPCLEAVYATPPPPATIPATDAAPVMNATRSFRRPLSMPSTISAPPDARPPSPHLHQDLADVLAREQRHERARRLLEALEDRLRVDDAALGEPAPHVVAELRHAVRVHAREEAAQRQTLRHGVEEVRRAGHGRGRVVR